MAVLTPDALPNTLPCRQTLSKSRFRVHNGDKLVNEKTIATVGKRGGWVSWGNQKSLRQRRDFYAEASALASKNLRTDLQSGKAFNHWLTYGVMDIAVGFQPIFHFIE